MNVLFPLFPLFLLITLITLQTFPLISCKPTPNPDSQSYILACGASSSDTGSDGRKWESDSQHITSSVSSISESADTQDPSLPSTVPYMNTRIFTSESTYKLPISTTSRYFIRLHFYPATYGPFDPRNSYFSVTANDFTLLNNFSASITTQALTQAYVIREFSITPSDLGILSITFKPSLNYEGSFAFINGIEVVPMADIYQTAKMVGFSDQSVKVDSYASQTMFRLNVGGQYISPLNDSGLTRTWYDDTPYLFGAASGVTSQANIMVQYPTRDVAKVIAPLDVYSTSRSMGPDPSVNKNYNLTWVFQIDANFTYVIRLHFCEFQESKVNQRVFDIYINNQTAQSGADVIAWSGSEGTPVYKDFAIYANDQSGDDELWLAMHPTVSMKPEYYDALLNGLEIFKLSDSNKNLAGLNPTPSAMMVQAEAKKGFSKDTGSDVGKVIGGIFGGFAALGLVAFVFMFLYRTNKNVNRNQSGSGHWLPLYSAHSRTTGSKSTITGRSNASSHLSTLAQGLCRHFSLPEIKNATGNFDESNVIGVGGFGNVYKGTIDQGSTKVAIKRSNPSSEQGVNEFNTEIEMLSKLRHKHLVSLIGFCEENGEMILVYDYMANGTLREHLYKSSKPSLPWKQRLEICIGAARGLHYLHTGARYTIIHRDVKSTNILLDENWVAKVSDFGLSKTGPNLNQTHVSTVVKGSFGYLDPEYFRRQQLTEKSDVYSFGVVLFEALCARPALNPSLPKEQVSLADWALHCQRKGTLLDVIDPKIKGQISTECFHKFAETAMKCLSDHGVYRPSMGDVLWNLEFALQLQDSPVAVQLVPHGVASIDEEGEGSLGSHDTNFSHTRGR